MRQQLSALQIVHRRVPLFASGVGKAREYGGTPREHSAAALVIGDELLNGSIADANVPVLAKFLYGRGVPLKKVEFVPDDEDVICEAVHRLGRSVTSIITTGGIGPTHDDKTYEALAKAYGTVLEEDTETMARLQAYLDEKAKGGSTGGRMTDARKRMAILPKASEKFRHDELWVPLVAIKRQCYIFPGVPWLFAKMLECYSPFLPRNAVVQFEKVNLYTTEFEGDIAEVLHEAELRSHGAVTIGSYPESDGLGGQQTRICIQGRDAGPVEEARQFISRAVQCQHHTTLAKQSV